MNVFVSEGAFLHAVVAKAEAQGTPVPHDAFGLWRLEALEPGRALADALGAMLGCDTAVVRKTDPRAAPANEADRQLIDASAQVAVHHAMRRASGVVALDEEEANPWRLQLVAYPRVLGGKPFDGASTPWFVGMVRAIGQPVALAG